MCSREQLGVGGGRGNGAYVTHNNVPGNTDIFNIHIFLTVLNFLDQFTSILVFHSFAFLT